MSLNISKIVDISNSRYYKMLAEWKQNGLPVYLFGCGEYAKNCWDTLQTDGIPIAGCYIDKKYWDAGLTFQGLSVLPFEVNNVKPCNLLVTVLFNRNKKDIEKQVYQRLSLSGIRVYPSGIIPIVDFIGCKTTLEFFQENTSLFETSYSWLEDDLSKTTFEEVLSARIQKDTNCISHFSENDQYVCMLGDNEYIVDVGAYTGDTIESFVKIDKMRREGNLREIVAFEPQPNSFQQMKNWVNRQNLPFPCTLIEKGCSDCYAKLRFSMCGTSASLNTSNIVDDYTEIEVDRLDAMLPSDKPVTFLKMDIEGEELKALHGAENTIKKWKPTLAICVYHRREDLITIPQYLKEIVPEYKLYLRQHTHFGTETVLYAKIK